MSSSRRRWAIARSSSSNDSSLRSLREPAADLPSAYVRDQSDFDPRRRESRVGYVAKFAAPGIRRRGGRQDLASNAVGRVQSSTSIRLRRYRHSRQALEGPLPTALAVTRPVASLPISESRLEGGTREVECAVHLRFTFFEKLRTPSSSLRPPSSSSARLPPQFFTGSSGPLSGSNQISENVSSKVG